VEERLYGCMAEVCRGAGCEPLAIGGVEDHVHVLVRFTPTVVIAKLVKDMKGSSSHLMTHELRAGVFFKWQGGYGAFTVQKSGVPRAVAYVEGQKEHHKKGELWGEWEEWDRE
jgi:REP element-mobilizing transposase RayT